MSRILGAIRPSNKEQYMPISAKVGTLKNSPNMIEDRNALSYSIRAIPCNSLKKKWCLLYLNETRHKHQFLQNVADRMCVPLSLFFLFG